MGSTSKSMHRVVQIKHDLMTRKCKYIDGLRHEMSGLCEKTNSIYIVFTSCYQLIMWVWNNMRMSK